MVLWVKLGLACKASSLFTSISLVPHITFLTTTKTTYIHCTYILHPVCTDTAREGLNYMHLRGVWQLASELKAPDVQHWTPCTSPKCPRAMQYVMNFFKIHSYSMSQF